MIGKVYGRTLIAAHRGGAGLWPENSLTAFRQSVRMPIDLIEFDVHRSADGVLVVFHDTTLDRTTNGTGPLYAQSLQSLRGLRLKGSTSDTIPLLDEVIETAKPSAVDLRLELKLRADGQRYPGLETEVIARLRETEMFDRTIFTSFDWSMLVTVQELSTPRGTVALVRAPAAATAADLEQACREAKTMGFAELGLPTTQMTAEKCALVRDHGLRCGAYGVNSREQIAAAFGLALAVFTTDRPDWAIDARDSLAGSAS